MPMVAGSLALNFILGVAVWFGGISTAAKILVTILIIGKSLLYLCSQWMGTERLRKIESGICIALNGALAAYGVGAGEYRIAVSAVLLLIPLTVWFFATFLKFPSQKSNQR